MNSYWQKNKKHINFKKDEDFNTDILIIGGGMVGLSTAFYLKDCNQKVILIEKDQIGFGVTSRSSAKITYLQETIYQDLEHLYDFNTAHNYLMSQLEASKELKRIIDQFQIKCDYEKTDSYLLAFEEKQIEKVKKEANFLKKCQIPYEEVKKKEIYGIKVSNTAVFHPVKYLNGLKKIIEKTIPIYEQICAEKIKKEGNGYLIQTNQNQIRAKQIVIATHYPFFLFPSLIPFHTYVEESYLLVAKTPKVEHYQYISVTKPTYSVRYHGDHLIFVGHAHPITNKFNRKENFEKMKQDYHKLYSYPILMEWSNQDLIASDFLPLIGETKKDSHLFLATGFRTWGMTNGTLAGKIISDIIIKGNSPYKDLFSLNRSYPLSKIKNLLVHNLETGKAFIQTKLIKKLPFYPSSIQIEKENGNLFGIYTDEFGKKHKVSLKCPHMKCNLIFNEQEKTWDCPCHSSRFTIDGDLIKGPSVYSIRVNDSN